MVEAGPARMKLTKKGLLAQARTVILLR